MIGVKIAEKRHNPDPFDVKHFDAAIPKKEVLEKDGAEIPSLMITLIYNNIKELKEKTNE